MTSHVGEYLRVADDDDDERTGIEDGGEEHVVDAGGVGVLGSASRVLLIESDLADRKQRRHQSEQGRYEPRQYSCDHEDVSAVEAAISVHGLGDEVEAIERDGSECEDTAPGRDDAGRGGDRARPLGDRVRPRAEDGDDVERHEQAREHVGRAQVDHVDVGRRSELPRERDGQDDEDVAYETDHGDDCGEDGEEEPLGVVQRALVLVRDIGRKFLRSVHHDDGRVPLLYKTFTYILLNRFKIIPIENSGPTLLRVMLYRCNYTTRNKITVLTTPSSNIKRDPM